MFWDSLNLIKEEVKDLLNGEKKNQPLQDFYLFDEKKLDQLKEFI